MNPKRVRRSLCSTTIWPTIGSVSHFSRFGRVSLTPEPLSLNLVAFGRTIIHPAFCLSPKMVLVFCCRHACINDGLWVGGDKHSFNDRLGHEDGAGISLKAGDLSGLEPAPGSTIEDTQ